MKAIDANIETFDKAMQTLLPDLEKPGIQRPICAWEYPKQPWEGVHVDYAGPVREHTFLLLVKSNNQQFGCAVHTRQRLWRPI